MKKILSILSVLSMCCCLVSCKSIDSSEFITGIESTETSTQETVTETMPTEPDKIVNIVAAGDNLIHSSIYNQAARRADYNGYNFDYAYERVEDMIKKADLAVLNQETVIANDIVPPADYPCFNSPVALGDKMIEMGFNAISHSNNHVLDQGEKGLIATLDYWNSRNILVYGAYRNEQELENIPTKEINGVTFSFVGFTEHTNGLSLPSGSECKIVYTSETDEMEHLIKKASGISDVVIVSVHWGDEGSGIVAERQKKLALKFAQWGANLIIGTHPHTPQSMEYLETCNDNQCFVAYSLGNFISAQDYPSLLVGIVLDLDVVKSGETGNIAIENIKARPVITHYSYGYKDITLYPYKEYNDELASVHGVNARVGFSMKKIDDILKGSIPDKFLFLS